MSARPDQDQESLEEEANKKAPRKCERADDAKTGPEMNDAGALSARGSVMSKNYPPAIGLRFSTPR